MNQLNQQILTRVLVHGFLAMFLANAANKFFVADLDYELEHHFYGRIFEGTGDAPDQYRILPLIPLKFLCQHLPFNHAVLIYNMVLGFLVFELFWWTMGTISRNKKFAFNTLFAVAYIYTQYSGWRPDTMGLIFLSSLLVSPLLLGIGEMNLWKGKPNIGGDGRENPSHQSENTSFHKVKSLGLLILLTGLAFSRADIAMVYSLWLAIYYTSKMGLVLLWLAIPPIVQFSLQEIIYPNASYYSDKIMLLDNLRGYYLSRHPATYLILALVLAFWRPILRFLRQSWKQKWFYFLCVAYLGLVLVIGRVNEYRLYLPLVPIFLVIWREYVSQHGTTTDPFRL